jgi:hypothetical protein
MEKTTASKTYWPLFALIGIAVLAASALTHGQRAGFHGWMHFFMGFFLCQFAMLKLFQPNQFADGFQMYDLVAKKARAYAYVYPYIELALGLAYLSFISPVLVYLVTIVVMGVGAIGVLKALKTGLKVNCACMGTILNVPLSTVTLTEDIGMGAMALLMLIMML